MNIFDSIQSIAPERSRKFLVDDFIGDVDTGACIPIDCFEVVPSDNIKLECDINVKSFPMSSSPFGSCTLDINSFFVPYTQLDDKFSERVTGCDEDGGDATIPYSLPMLSSHLTDLQRAKPHGKYCLRDYLGIAPINTDIGESTSKDALNMTILPYNELAYYRIWNYYYRDPIHCIDSNGRPIMHVDSLTHDLDSSGKYSWFGDNASLRSLGKYNGTDSDMVLYSTLEADYFTRILARRQAGITPTLTVSGLAPVYPAFEKSNGDLDFIYNNSMKHPNLGVQFGSPNPVGQGLGMNATGNAKDSMGNVIGEFTGNSDYKYLAKLYPDSSYMPIQLGADLSSSIGFSIEEWRTAMLLQRYYERINVSGSTYEQYLLSMFSTAPHSEVLREPVWIGGFRLPIVFSDVTGTSDSNLGERVSNAWTQGSEYIGDYFSKDYGVIMTIATIRPNVSYAQGIERQWIKPNRFSWLNPVFERLGEQEVYKSELFHLATDDSTDSSTSHTSAFDEILGFNPRYSELYVGHKRVTGSFRDTMSNEIFSRAFSTTPSLTKDLFVCNPSEYADKWTVTDVPVWKLESRIRVDATRPIMDNPMAL